MRLTLIMTWEATQWKCAILQEWSRDKIKPAHVTGMQCRTICSFSKADVKI